MISEQTVIVNGFNIHIRTERNGDLDVINEVLVGDCYGLQTLKSLMPHWEPKFVLDIGAHIGTFAMLVHKLWPETKIVCFEPNARSFGLLQQNVEGFADCWNAAIRYDGSIALTDGIGATGGGYMTSREDFERMFQGTPQPDYHIVHDNVTTWTIEDVVRRYNTPSIELLKLDCEGSEFDIALHIKQDTSAMIKRIVGEYHAAGGFSEWARVAQDAFPHLEFTGSDSGRQIDYFQAS